MSLTTTNASASYYRNTNDTEVKQPSIDIFENKKATNTLKTTPIVDSNYLKRFHTDLGDPNILETFPNLKFLAVSSYSRIDSDDLPLLCKDLLALRNKSAKYKIIANRILAGIISAGVDSWEDVGINPKNATSVQKIADLCEGYWDEIYNLEISWFMLLKDVSALEKFSSLNRLVLKYCPQVSDITFSAKLTRLTHFALTACPNIKNIEPLQYNTRLKNVWLNNLSIQDLSPLGKCTDLVILKLEGLPKIKELESLEECKNLRGVEIINCRNILDFYPFNEYQSLNRGLDLLIHERINKTVQTLDECH